MSATVHDFAAARRAVLSQTLRFPEFPSSGKKPARAKSLGQRALKKSIKCAAVRQAGKARL